MRIDSFWAKSFVESFVSWWGLVANIRGHVACFIIWSFIRWFVLAKSELLLVSFSYLRRDTTHRDMGSGIDLILIFHYLVISSHRLAECNGNRSDNRCQKRFFDTTKRLCAGVRWFWWWLCGQRSRIKNNALSFGLWLEFPHALSHVTWASPGRSFWRWPCCFHVVMVRRAHHEFLTGTLLWVLSSPKDRTTLDNVSYGTYEALQYGVMSRITNYKCLLLPMTWPLRLEFPHALHHVMSHGDRWEVIFDDDDDCVSFLKILGVVVIDYHWLCHVYCLMSNHTFRGILLSHMKSEPKHINSKALTNSV